MGIRRASFSVPFSAILLVTLLVLGSVGTTVARAHHASLTAVELCGLNGSATVLIDRQGNPAAPMPACPDCIAGLAMLAEPANAAPTDPPSVRRLRALSARPVPASPETGLPPARAPPVPV